MIDEEDLKLIDSVMDWFDFGRCTKMMGVVNFGWTRSLEDFSEPVLREFVRRQIISSHDRFIDNDRKRVIVSTGGIRVVWDCEGGKTFLAVEAVLESWECVSVGGA